MGNLVLANNLPDHLKQYQDEVEQISGLATSAGGNRISIKGKQFRFIKDGEEIGKLKIGMPVSVVILGHDPDIGVAKSYYSNAYSTDDDVSLPDCYSHDGIKPSQSAEKPQCETCATCKWNAFGTGRDSAGNIGKGKACSDFKNIYVVLDDQLEGLIFNLRVPATSLKPLSIFAKELVRHKVPGFGIKTQIAFNENIDHPQLTFDLIDFLDETQAKYMHERSKSSELRMMQPSRNEQAPVQNKPQELPMSPQDSKPIPPPPGKEVPGKRMTDKAKGVPYDAYIKQGWTDDQLVENGYMVMEA